MGAMATAVGAVLIGIPAVRLRGLHLAVASLALSLAVTNVLLSPAFLGRLMKPWEIWTWQFQFGSHPAVIRSNPARVERKDDVVIISCSTRQANRAPELF